ncbi:MAG: Holliday junction resolvase RuvX [Thiobacillaceae bacterium]|nr:Holliday junction resolvase RuvX [Thiobacillaceae bacterium]MDW8324540.1 Holliday junction resolvase RuvX [Burkholderiales bacterium]
MALLRGAFTAAPQAAVPTSALCPRSTAPRKGTVLAFDFGLKRIGVAVGEWETRTAHPLTTLNAEANAERFARIGALLQEWRPVELVVGLPLALTGEAHALTQRCRRFAHQLEGRFGLPVALVDERLTSVEAEARLREAGVRGRAVAAAVDALAAQRILEDFFRQQA